MTNYSTSEKPNDVEIYKVDTQEEKELIRKYNVYGVPVLIYFKNGKEIAREFGVKSQEQLKESVNKYFR